MSALSDKDWAFLRLIARSPDKGDGWRTVSSLLWPTVLAMAANIPDLFELGEQRVRLTEKGNTVLEYLG